MCAFDIITELHMYTYSQTKLSIMEMPWAEDAVIPRPSTNNRKSAIRAVI